MTTFIVASCCPLVPHSCKMENSLVSLMHVRHNVQKIGEWQPRRRLSAT